MRKLYKKIENWIWIILLICALIYFNSLVKNFQSENEKLKETQTQFYQEVEEKYQRNKGLQVEIQAQLNEIAQTLLEFLKATQSFDPKSLKRLARVLEGIRCPPPMLRRGEGILFFDFHSEM